MLNQNNECVQGALTGDTLRSLCQTLTSRLSLVRPASSPEHNQYKMSSWVFLITINGTNGTNGFVTAYNNYFCISNINNLCSMVRKCFICKGNGVFWCLLKFVPVCKTRMSTKNTYFRS